VAIAEWLLVGTLAQIVARLPAGLAYTLGERAGRLAFRLDKRHHRIAMDNLSRAFPGEYSPREVEALARGVFENLGRTAVDMARSADLLSRTGGDAVQVDGFDRLLEAKRRGRGVLLIGAHFGPWELLPLLASRYFEPVHVVARPLDNPWLDDLLVSVRERGGNTVIRKQDAVLAILQVLRRGETVGILIDQHITEKEGVVVPFFGRPASTAFAPALIAIRSGAAVLPVVITREGHGRYRVHIAEEVSLRRSGDLRADLAVNTARFTAAIEALIRRRPDHWFWVHRRWKTRHPLDPKLEIGNWKLDAEGRVEDCEKIRGSADLPPVAR
jgi:KDO2-lipid IV(A) lauroyltransferase